MTKDNLDGLKRFVEVEELLKSKPDTPTREPLNTRRNRFRYFLKRIRYWIEDLFPIQPNAYSASELKEWNTTVGLKGGGCIPARPDGGHDYEWERRWVLAYKVLIGKYDALSWGVYEDNEVIE